MWQYQNTDELYHYGVLGMKCGKRKSLPKLDLRTRYDRAKADKKASYKEYSKSYDKTYHYAQRHPIGTIVGITKYGKKIKNNYKNMVNDTLNKIDKYQKANKKYKTIKKERKEAFKSIYKDLEKNSNISEKILFNNAIREKLAKYVVDNNMSIEEAKKKTKKEAIRNTAVILGSIGAYKIRKAAINKYLNTHDIKMPNGTIILSPNHYSTVKDTVKGLLNR